MSTLSLFHAALAMLCLAGLAAEVHGDPLPVRPIARGALSGIAEGREQVVTDTATWNKVWVQHRSQIKEANDRPAVDFSKEMVLVVTLGRKRTGGYAVEISRVELRDERLLVTVRRTTPKPGGLAMQVLTAPFHFVAVPRSSLPVEFAEAKP